MWTNELRKDYLLDRWVVIATQRKRRPTDFIRVRDVTKSSSCPFCPGNEHMTPPATLVYLQQDGKIVKEEDSESSRHKDWLIRCVSNLYPAFSPPNTDKSETTEKGHFELMKSIGFHEVIIESPRHEEHPGVARVSQLLHLIHAYQDRLKVIYSKDYVKYVSLFRNHGQIAGASLSHAHSQIIATPIIPHIAKEELERSKIFWDAHEKCVFCDIIENESKSPRLIWDNEGFIVFAPWASVHPYEFWIFPKRHQSNILDMTENEVEEMAKAMRVCFGGLKTLINDPSYNFGIHLMPSEHYHWHIEVYPRLTIWAGFEKSTGIFINIVTPEDAASSLREAIHEEELEIRL